MGELSKLANIGQAVEEQLNQVGIHTAQQLRDTGSKRAWLAIQAFDRWIIWMGGSILSP